MHDQLKILVVDDDPGILDVFSGYFEGNTQYSILTAADGFSALEIFVKEKPGFCFTDLSMPGMDGIDLSRQIFEIDDTAPIVIMTAFPSMDSTIHALKLGVMDFIIKPFKIRDIEFIITKALAQKKMMIENLLLSGEYRKKKELELLNRDLYAKVNEMEKLNHILQKVDWKKSSADLFDQLTGISCKISGADMVFFHIFDDTSGTLTKISSDFRNNDCGPERTPAFIYPLARQAIQQQKAVIWDANQSRMSDNVQKALSIPLNIKDKVLGTLSLCMAGGAHGFDDKDIHYLNFIIKRAAMIVENTALYENICQNLFSTLYAFVEAIEARDPYTKQHSVRVAEISVAIARHMHCSPREIDVVDFAGRLHDIGKIGIRDNILLKKGRLDNEEFTIIKTHPVIGADIVGHLGLLFEETRIIRHHHERWDGHGYPDCLAKEDIPLLSRIMAVADTFDAMTSNRAYRKKLDERVAFDTVKKNAGSQFDPRVSEAFLQLAKKGFITATPL